MQVVTFAYFVDHQLEREASRLIPTLRVIQSSSTSWCFSDPGPNPSGFGADRRNLAEIAQESKANHHRQIMQKLSKRRFLRLKSVCGHLGRVFPGL